MKTMREEILERDYESAIKALRKLLESCGHLIPPCLEKTDAIYVINEFYRKKKLDKGE